VLAKNPYQHGSNKFPWLPSRYVPPRRGNLEAALEQRHIGEGVERCGHLEIRPGVKTLYAIFIVKKEQKRKVTRSIYWMEKVLYSEAVPDRQMKGGVAELILWYISQGDAGKKSKIL
jgi:hypothetical protein